MRLPVLPNWLASEQSSTSDCKERISVSKGANDRQTFSKNKNGNELTHKHSFILMIHVELAQNIYCYSNLILATVETKKLNIDRVVCLCRDEYYAT